MNLEGIVVVQDLVAQQQWTILAADTLSQLTLGVQAFVSDLRSVQSPIPCLQQKAKIRQFYSVAANSKSLALAAQGHFITRVQHDYQTAAAVQQAFDRLCHTNGIQEEAECGRVMNACNPAYHHSTSQGSSTAVPRRSSTRVQSAATQEHGVPQEPETENNSSECQSMKHRFASQLQGGDGTSSSGRGTPIECATRPQNTCEEGGMVLATHEAVQLLTGKLEDTQA